MQQHHYLESLNKIGETIWYVAIYKKQWVALLCFSSGALHCSDRDRWIGWKYRNQYDRLHLPVNNTRFLILPDYHFKNLGLPITQYYNTHIMSVIVHESNNCHTQKKFLHEGCNCKQSTSRC